MELIEKIKHLLEYYQSMTGEEIYIDRTMIKNYEDQFLDLIHQLKQFDYLPENATPLDLYRLRIEKCTRCRLSKERNKFVFGEGNPSADIMFIGEAPGRDEDIQGIPFVGKAGQLLDKILSAIQLNREEVYIANIVKCRPPQNRTPSTDEIDTCFPYIEEQIKMIQPKIICLLGAVAARRILNQNASISSLRGRIHQYGQIETIVTYHPAALLRNEQLKRPTWDDMKILRKLYDEKYLNKPFILEKKNG